MYKMGLIEHFVCSSRDVIKYKWTRHFQLDAHGKIFQEPCLKVINCHRNQLMSLSVKKNIFIIYIFIYKVGRKSERVHADSKVPEGRNYAEKLDISQIQKEYIRDDKAQQRNINGSDSLPSAVAKHIFTFILRFDRNTF